MEQMQDGDTMYEIIEQDIWYDDPVGKRIPEGANVLGVFEEYRLGAYRLKAFHTAAGVRAALADTAPEIRYKAPAQPGVEIEVEGETDGVECLGCEFEADTRIQGEELRDAAEHVAASGHEVRVALSFSYTLAPEAKPLTTQQQELQE